MSRTKPWAARAARSLSRHLDRLREALASLHGRLREAVAEAVGRNAAGAVRDAVLAALPAPCGSPAEAAPSRATPRPYDGPRYGEGPRWDDDPYAESWGRGPYEDDFEDYGEEGPAAEAAPAPQAPAGRLGRAVAVGCQAAAWWLGRRGGGRFAGLLALAVGAAAGAAAFYFSPFVGAAAALAGSAAGLAAVSNAARYGAAPPNAAGAH